MKKRVRQTIIFLCCWFHLASGIAEENSDRIALPNQLQAPSSIAGSSGMFMSPYTLDGVLAPWVSKAIELDVGVSLGGLVGAHVGNIALSSVPILGGVLGNEIGEETGKQVALDAIGGWDYVRETSDQSFYNVKEMAVFLYVKHSTHKHYKEALAATYVFYPELKNNYYQAILEASEEAFAFEVEF